MGCTKSKEKKGGKGKGNEKKPTETKPTEKKPENKGNAQRADSSKPSEGGKGRTWTKSSPPYHLYPRILLLIFLC